MKLFQIEEPDGGPTDLEGPGAAVGIDVAPDLGGAVAIAVAGNAELLPGADGERRLALMGTDGAALGALLLGLRERAEKQLARPVSHAVIASALARATVEAAAEQAGLAVLRLLDRAAAAALAGAAGDDAAVLGAAMQAEDDSFATGAR
jgi:hypothetical protein